MKFIFCSFCFSVNGIALIENALPPNADFTKLARGIETYAAENQFQLNQLQIDSAPISPLTEKQKLQKMNFILIGKGSYASVKIYLNDILNWKRIITVDSLDLVQEGGTV